MIEGLELTYFTESIILHQHVLYKAEEKVVEPTTVNTTSKDPRLRNTAVDKPAISESTELIQTLTSLIQIQQLTPSPDNLAAIMAVLPILQNCKTTSTADQLIVAQLSAIINAGALNPPVAKAPAFKLTEVKIM